MRAPPPPWGRVLSNNLGDTSVRAVGVAEAVATLREDRETGVTLFPTLHFGLQMGFTQNANGPRDLGISLPLPQAHGGPQGRCPRLPQTLPSLS